jgi:MFS family permease
MLRPLWLDFALLALPFLVAAALVALGRTAWRWPIPVRVGAGVACFVVLVAPLALRSAAVPPSLALEVGGAFALVGGVTLAESLLAMFLLGVAVGAPKRRMSGTFLGVLVGVIAIVIGVDRWGPFLWRWSQPVAWANHVDGDGRIIQSTGMSCAPAAAAMLLARYDVDVSEGQMAYLAGTSRFGTDEHELAAAINVAAGSQGVRVAATRGTIDEWTGRPRPFIAYVELSFGTHAILVESITPKLVEFVDPLRGDRQWVDRATFESVWLGVAIGAR